MQPNRPPATAPPAGATPAVDLNDLRPALDLPGQSPGVDFETLHALRQVVQGWESELRLDADPRLAQRRPLDGRWPSAFWSPFIDQETGHWSHAPTSFTSFPADLQALLGGLATHAWYVWAAMEDPFPLPEVTHRLIRSTWELGELAVADLAALVLTPTAVRTVWPKTGPANLGSPMVYDGTFTTVIAHHTVPPVPIIIYDGHIHRGSVLYALALLRFVQPQDRVLALAGSPGPGAFAAPAMPPGPPPEAGSAGADTLQAADVAVMGWPGEVHQASWSAFGLQEPATDDATALHALRQKIQSAQPPYALYPDRVVDGLTDPVSRGGFAPVMDWAERIVSMIARRTGSNRAAQDANRAAEIEQVRAALDAVTTMRLRPYLPEVAV